MGKENAKPNSETHRRTNSEPGRQHQKRIDNRVSRREQNHEQIAKPLSKTTKSTSMHQRITPPSAKTPINTTKPEVHNSKRYVRLTQSQIEHKQNSNEPPTTNLIDSNAAIQPPIKRKNYALADQIQSRLRIFLIYLAYAFSFISYPIRSHTF